jgi:ferrous iron transport protein A
LHIEIISMNAPSPGFSKESAPLASTGVMGLDECRKGTQVRIVGLQAQTLFGTQDDRVTLRLKELGFLPGALLKVIGFGLLGSDPLAVQVNGTKFALRRAEAAKIRVELISGSH